MMRLRRVELLTHLAKAVINPAADRVIATGQEVGVMGMQALHANPGAADATVGGRPVMVVGNPGISFCCIGRVGATERIRVNLGLDPIDGAGGLQLTDRLVQRFVDQPVPGWHRPTGRQQRFVAQHHRPPIGAPHHHFVLALGATSEQLCDTLMIRTVGSLAGRLTIRVDQLMIQ